MADNPAWSICERVAEAQALLEECLADCKHPAAGAVGQWDGGGPVAPGDIRCRPLPPNTQPGDLGPNPASNPGQITATGGGYAG